MGNSHNMGNSRHLTYRDHSLAHTPLLPPFLPPTTPPLAHSLTNTLVSLDPHTSNPWLTPTRSVLGTKEGNLAHTKREKAKVSDLLVADVFDKFEHLGLVTWKSQTVCHGANSQGHQHDCFAPPHENGKHMQTKGENIIIIGRRWRLIIDLATYIYKCMYPHTHDTPAHTTKRQPHTNKGKHVHAKFVWTHTQHTHTTHCTHTAVPLHAPHSHIHAHKCWIGHM